MMLKPITEVSFLEDLACFAVTSPVGVYVCERERVWVRACEGACFHEAGVTVGGLGLFCRRVLKMCVCVRESG